MRIAASYFVFCLLVTYCTADTSAEMYKWKDEHGVVHFSDLKPVNVEPELYELKSINTYVETQDLSNATFSANNVIIYSTKWCGVCKRAKTYFNKNNIVFTEYDIEQSSSARNEFNRYGGRGIPLILVGNTKMHGFSENRFEALWKR